MTCAKTFIGKYQFGFHTRYIWYRKTDEELKFFFIAIVGYVQFVRNCACAALAAIFI